MAFEKEPVRTPTAIGTMKLEITSFDPILNETGTVDHNIEVKFSDGSTKILSGNALPHLTTAQKNGLVALMADLRQKAESGILP